MPKTVGAEALSMQDNAFCVSVTPTEEKSFYDDDFCLSVYVLTYVWEVFYIRNSCRQSERCGIRLKIYKEVRKWQRLN